MSATVHCFINSLRRPLNCILSATKEKQQFSSSYAVASPQGAAVGGRHKQARDSRVDRQHIHDEVGQQLVHTDKHFRLARPGRSTHSGGLETAGSVYLIRTVHIPVWKRIAVLINGEHGEARKHGQAHSDPQADHVHIQRPEAWKTEALSQSLCSTKGERKRQRAQVCSHLCVSQGFAGDVALHLRLVDGVDGHPHDAAAEYNGPESVSPQRIWVKAKADGMLKKQKHLTHLRQQWQKNCHTYSNASSRPPRPASSQMFVKPPCKTAPRAMTATKPASMITICMTSVQITAFRPPCDKTSLVSCQGHLMEIWSFNKNLQNKNLQMINVPKTKNTETFRLIFTPQNQTTSMTAYFNPFKMSNCANFPFTDVFSINVFPFRALPPVRCPPKFLNLFFSRFKTAFSVKLTSSIFAEGSKQRAKMPCSVNLYAFFFFVIFI